MNLAERTLYITKLETRGEMTRRYKNSRNSRQANDIRQLPWRDIVNTYAPMEILDAEQIEQIHQSSLTLLQNYGMHIMHAGARTMLAGAGADVDHDTG